MGKGVSEGGESQPLIQKQLRHWKEEETDCMDENRHQPKQSIYVDYVTIGVERRALLRESHLRVYPLSVVRTRGFSRT